MCIQLIQSIVPILLISLIKLLSLSYFCSLYLTDFKSEKKILVKCCFWRVYIIDLIIFIEKPVLLKVENTSILNLLLKIENSISEIFSLRADVKYCIMMVFPFLGVSTKVNYLSNFREFHSVYDISKSNLFFFI